MRIFLISNMFPSKKDKLYGVFVQNMYAELKKQGVIFPYKALIRGRTTAKFGKIKKYLIHYCLIIRHFFKSNYDILYVHYYSHHVPILWLLSAFKKTPWVINVHGTDVIDLMKDRKLDYFAKIVLKKVDLLVVPSAYYKTVALKHYSFLTSDRVFISPSGGLDLTNFKPTPPPSYNTKKINLGFVSRFEEAKGWKIFLEALAELKQNSISFKGIIIGKGPDKSKIKSAIKTRGLEKHIDFIGFVKQTELNVFYNKMDIYIFPSYSESLGLTGLEAMACGKPVIGSAIAGLKTYIKPGENGFLFKPGNAEDLTVKIKTYMALSEGNQTELQKNACQTAEAYERTNITKELIKKLNSIIQ